jgi:hypothetical protein
VYCVCRDKLVDWRLLRYAYLQGLGESIVAFAMFFYAMWDYSDGRVLPADLFLAWEHWGAEVEVSELQEGGVALWCLLPSYTSTATHNQDHHQQS